MIIKLPDFYFSIKLVRYIRTYTTTARCFFLKINDIYRKTNEIQNVLQPITRGAEPTKGGHDQKSRG